MWRIWLFKLILFCSPPLYADTSKDQAKAGASTLTQSVGVSDYFQVLLGLIVVVVAIVAMAWMIKRIGYIQTRTHGALKIIGGIPLSQREKLVLVQVGKQQLLLGVAPGRISTVHLLEEPIVTDQVDGVKPTSFQDKLQMILKGGRK